MVKFDGVGALEVDDKKLLKIPQHQKKPKFLKKLTYPPPHSDDGQPSILLEPLNIQTMSKDKSLHPSYQVHIEENTVDSVKLTIDP